MTQEFRGYTQGQFAGRDIVNNHYAPKDKIPWQQRPDDELKQMISLEKKKRLNAVKRKYINVPSIMFLLMMLLPLYMLYFVGSEILLYKDWSVLTRLSLFIQEHLIYVYSFLGVLVAVVFWVTKKTRLENRIIRESNINIDDITTVLKGRH
ncbi:hypothetical protein EKN56_06435 [Limnobaculum zhutongyuii]|uniref:Uncharacterized protein n=1 Tax=Limnobaculum zhutongyuii TaxID=2498113 RepID=A0A411WIR5_9GAMM|nr:hypothetical protein [Limnobaculum zhutongyuii]QBH96066.1 hypothetical protein EKN56_06435 [Limnobaculum zhutongyuii]TQS86151.1 hypothetical protein ELQ32_20260 [Limnobaculum zhutongyuii]